MRTITVNVLPFNLCFLIACGCVNQEAPPKPESGEFKSIVTQSSDATPIAPIKKSTDTDLDSGWESPLAKAELFLIDRPSSLPPPIPRACLEARQIEELVKQFEDLRTPTPGLSQTIDANSFSPISQAEFNAHFRADGQTKLRFRPLEEVVRQGVAAIPILLREIRNTTPTQLNVAIEPYGFEFMFLSIRSPHLNALNKKESEALKQWHQVFQEEKSIVSHTVTVGDVCFLALGQIVGRNYSVLRYQPSSLIFVNSPVRNRLHAEFVEASWGHCHSDADLLDTLMVDYCTRGKFNGVNLDGWSAASDFQVRSIRRLLFYYPEIGVEIAVSRLRSLDVSGTSESYVQLQVENGVIATDFIDAVSWCNDANLLAALNEVRTRSDDPRILEVLEPVPGFKKK